MTKTLFSIINVSYTEWDSEGNGTKDIIHSGGIYDNFDSAIRAAFESASYTINFGEIAHFKKPYYITPLGPMVLRRNTKATNIGLLASGIKDSADIEDGYWFSIVTIKDGIIYCLKNYLIFNNDVSIEKEAQILSVDVSMEKEKNDTQD